MYVAIDLVTKLTLISNSVDRRGTDPIAAFLHRLAEKHDFSEAKLLVDIY